MFPARSGTLSTLPPGWNAYTDPSTSRVYYVNASTGATQWTRPNPPLALPPAPVQINTAPPRTPRPMAQTQNFNQSLQYSTAHIVPHPSVSHPSATYPSATYPSAPHSSAPHQSVPRQSVPHTPVPHTPTPHTLTPHTPAPHPQVQCQPQYQSNHGTLSNGWGNSGQNYNPAFHQSNTPRNGQTFNPAFSQRNPIRNLSHNTPINVPPPPPQALSRAYNPQSQWQPKRPRPPYFNKYSPPAKRTYIQHASNVDNTRKRCSKCGLVRKHEFFSKTQFMANDMLRKCKSCVDHPAEKTQAKKCSSCGKVRGVDLYSKRQWGCADDTRKCKPCVDKFLAEKEKAEESNAQEEDGVPEAPKVCSPVSVPECTSDPKKTETKEGGTEDAGSEEADSKDSDSKEVDTQPEGTKSEGTKLEETNHAEKTVGKGVKVCSSCKEQKGVELFSKRQWGLSGEGRKCISCMDKFMTSNLLKKTDFSESQLDEGPKLCSSCRKVQGLGSFSKRQWGTRSSERKCKKCVIKYLASLRKTAGKPGDTGGSSCLKEGEQRGNDNLSVSKSKQICDEPDASEVKEHGIDIARVVKSEQTSDDAKTVKIKEEHESKVAAVEKSEQTSGKMETVKEAKEHDSNIAHVVKSENEVAHVVKSEATCDGADLEEVEDGKQQVYDVGLKKTAGDVSMSTPLPREANFQPGNAHDSGSLKPVQTCEQMKNVEGDKKPLLEQEAMEPPIPSEEIQVSEDSKTEGSNDGVEAVVVQLYAHSVETQESYFGTKGHPKNMPGIPGDAIIDQSSENLLNSGSAGAPQALNANEHGSLVVKQGDAPNADPEPQDSLHSSGGRANEFTN